MPVTDEMVERGARAHNPLAFEMDDGDYLLEDIARVSARNEVREILTAALSDQVVGGWQPIDTCPKADYKSYFLFNDLWEDGWSTVQRANYFDGVWIFDSGLSLTDCETKFNPVMWHADMTPAPPPASTAGEEKR